MSQTPSQISTKTVFDLTPAVQDSLRKWISAEPKDFESLINDKALRLSTKQQEKRLVKLRNMKKFEIETEN